MLHWLPDAFRDAISRGDVSSVTASLSLDPSLAYTRTKWTKTTALMLCTVAPNAIRLMELLRRCDVRLDARDANHRHALLFACEYGAEPATVDYLLAWSTHSPWGRLEGYTNSNTDVIMLAMKSGNASLVHHLMDLIVAPPAIPAMGQRCSFATNFGLVLLVAAIQTTHEDLALRCLDLPIVHSALIDFCESNKAVDISSMRCAVQAVTHRMRGVVHGLETYGLRVRRAVFAQCYYSPDRNEHWKDVCLRFERDATWENVRGAFLVQRRCVGLPDHMGWRIACYVFEFDATDQAWPFWCGECNSPGDTCCCHAGSFDDDSMHWVDEDVDAGDYYA
ncbi:Aste57867_15511 [Aphanomyces stellatus]|uniref:Aste57867_15511 protein n=1 Tax=Aphanomyces stellatus TaxID=120398 RepID=A0A485L4A7_9STRA|nr:hypothetical protein As57867_015455 [Aphanomyces stellatus]VFT92313.1 Aste57867_15511 [Aphanomyces stellatus]